MAFDLGLENKVVVITGGATGIGLYLCRLIVTRLGGDIRVCPEYSGGCCIRIELPY